MHISFLLGVPGEDQLAGLVTDILCLVSATQDFICEGAPTTDDLEDAPAEEDLEEDVSADDALKDAPAEDDLEYIPAEYVLESVLTEDVIGVNPRSRGAQRCYC